MKTKPLPGTTILAVLGPTAVGKTYVALRTAPELNAEIVSIDSMQVYRGMDIATSKPDVEDIAQTGYHLIDVVDLDFEFNVAIFKRMAEIATCEILSRGNIPMLVGGSGLYFRAVVDDLDFPGGQYDQEELEGLSAEELYGKLKEVDEAAAGEIPPTNRRRIMRALEVGMYTERSISERQASWNLYSSPYRLIAVGLDIRREVLYELIEERVDRMFERGLVEEVRSMLERGIRFGKTAKGALGYRQVLDYLSGNTSEEEAIEETKKRTRNYAKRQLTWFKRDPRIKWFTVAAEPGAGSGEVEESLAETSKAVLEYISDKLEN